MSTRSRPGSVFISYKSEEKPKAAHLQQALVEGGFNVWWDEDLQCGQAWAEKIDEAVRDAACIIVLWSARSVASQWVRHEASQGIAREVYAPCRVELVQLDSPYDRIQATDLIGWDGDREHAGFRNLIHRVDALLPAPVSLPRRIGRWLRANLSTLVASSIAVLAMFVLLTIFVEQKADRREKVYDCSASAKLRTVLALEMYSKGQSLEGVCLGYTDFSGADFSGADFSGADLSEADLSGADLSEADLRRTTLLRTDLSGADLSGAMLNWYSRLERADLSGADLSGVDFGGTSLRNVKLGGACADPQPLIWHRDPLPACPRAGEPGVISHEVRSGSR